MVPSETQTSRGFFICAVTKFQHQALLRRSTLGSTASSAAPLTYQGWTASHGPQMPWHNPCRCSAMALRVQQQGLAPPVPRTLKHPCFSWSSGQKLLISELFFQTPDRYQARLVPEAGRGTSWTHRHVYKHNLAPFCSACGRAIAGAGPWVHGAGFLLLACLEGGTRKALLAGRNNFKSVRKGSS